MSETLCVEVTAGMAVVPCPCRRAITYLKTLITYSHSKTAAMSNSGPNGTAEEKDAALTSRQTHVDPSWTTQTDVDGWRRCSPCSVGPALMRPAILSLAQHANRLHEHTTPCTDHTLVFHIRSRPPPSFFWRIFIFCLQTLCLYRRIREPSFLHVQLQPSRMMHQTHFLYIIRLCIRTDFSTNFIRRCSFAAKITVLTLLVNFAQNKSL
jgi:hypothetical protein